METVQRLRERYASAGRPLPSELEGSLSGAGLVQRNYVNDLDWVLDDYKARIPQKAVDRSR